MYVLHSHTGSEETQTVVSMVRQIGKCSFFVTLSAAENKWPELLVTLTKPLRRKKLTVEEAKNLSFEKNMPHKNGFCDMYASF